jgi:hypothetical protein
MSRHVLVSGQRSRNTLDEGSASYPIFVGEYLFLGKGLLRGSPPSQTAKHA